MSALVSSLASAGPPLISDDPHTIGRGRVEAILTTSGAGQDGIASISAPLFDVTIGVLDGVDLLLVAAPTFLAGTSQQETISGDFEVGFKWRPIATGAFAASFTPVVGANVLSGSRMFLSLPLQVEYARGRWAIGLDGGYQIVEEGLDGWHAGAYSTFRVRSDLLLLAEVWALRAAALDAANFGAGLGVDWTFRDGLALLAMVGTGIDSHRSTRVDWVGYLGVRAAFPLASLGSLMRR